MLYRVPRYALKKKKKNVSELPIVRTILHTTVHLALPDMSGYLSLSPILFRSSPTLDGSELVL